MRLHACKKIKDGELDYANYASALCLAYIWTRLSVTQSKTGYQLATVLQPVFSSPVFDHRPLSQARESSGVKLVLCAPDLG